MKSSLTWLEASVRCPLWTMVSALTLVFGLSHTFRTLPTIMAGQVESEFGVSSRGLGLFAAAFHLSFAAFQLFVGVSLDRYGPRRTLLAFFMLAIVGGAVSAAAPNFSTLVLGQFLIGIGCSPALIATLVFINRRYAVGEFGRLSGMVMSFGGLGMLVSGTPLAWVVQEWSWRMGFVVITVVAAMAWLTVALLVDDGVTEAPKDRRTVADSFRELLPILADKRVIGILGMAAVAYPAFITLRGLWMVPLLVQRHDFTLVESGHVASALSVAGLFGPIMFGYLDPSDRVRRYCIVGCTFGFALLFVTLALNLPAIVDITLLVFSGFLSGYMVLQYSHVRAAYSAEVAGRALAVFTMAMFLGVAAMQMITGFVAPLGPVLGINPIVAVLLTIAFLLAVGAIGFATLPGTISQPATRR